MRKVLTLSLQIAFLLAICCSAFTTAHATTIYTDELFCESEFLDCGAFSPGPPPQPITSLEVIGAAYGHSFGPWRNPYTTYTSASYDAFASVINFAESIYCQEEGLLQMCFYNWGGDFSGGSISINMSVNHDGYLSNLQFIGTITGGSFYEYYNDPCGIGYDFPCYQQGADLSFSGQWSNGWRSTGDVQMFLEFSVGSGGDSHMVLNTQTPEPASLALFGSGVLGLAGVLRRRLSV